MPSNVLRYLGLARETGGYAVEPAAPVVDFDVSSLSLDSPGEPFLTYEGGIGRMPARVMPGVYVPSGGAEFPIVITEAAYIFNLLLGDHSIVSTGIGSVAAEALVTGVGETSKQFTLAESPVVQGSFILDDGGDVAHDDGFGNIVEDNSSGISGWIDYVNGIVYMTGLTASTSYSADYDYKDSDWHVHTIVPVTGNTMPSFTAYAGKDIFEHKVKGCVLNQLDLAVEQELVNLTLDIQGSIDAKGTIRDLEDLHLDLCRGERPRVYHDCLLKVCDYGGTLSDISADVRSLSMTFNNNATTEENIGLNSRFPQNGTAGALDISGSMTLQFDSTEYKEDFWGGATGPTADPILKAMELTIDAGAWGNAVISLGRVLLQTVNIQPSGREKLMQEINFKAFWDCTTEEIVKAVIRNLNTRI